ncbi:MAG: TetR family transcriptional regulator C-terminal domain-containing protein [Pseudomonadota bacterium]
MADAASARPLRLPPDARRAQILEATLRCLARNGPERWTLRQVSRELGVAPSLVTHFFGTWNDLLVAAYRVLSDRFAAEFSAIAEAPGQSAGTRIGAYIRAFFADTWRDEDTAGAYIAFWALARSEPRLRGVMDEFARTSRRILAPMIADYARERGYPGDPAPVAETFAYLTSGLWYEIAVNPASLSAKAATAQAEAYLEMALTQRPNPTPSDGGQDGG